MKRFILSFIAVGGSFLMVVFSAVAVERTQSDLVPITNEASESAVLAPVVEEQAIEVSSEVNYYLPYPGVLPDHNLYVLKMIRDRARLLLANSPDKKFELQLLYADKRIGAAEALFKGGKVQLAYETAYKAQGYLQQALTSAQAIDKLEHWQVLALATQKHREILELLAQSEGEISRVERAQEVNRSISDQLATKIPTENSKPVVEIPVSTEEEIYPAEVAR